MPVRRRRRDAGPPRGLARGPPSCARPPTCSTASREVVGPPTSCSTPTSWPPTPATGPGGSPARAPAVVRPGSTAEVADGRRLCREHGRRSRPPGGQHRMVGGGVPLHGEVVLVAAAAGPAPRSTWRPDRSRRGAGATVAEVQRASRRAPGWAYGVDLASRDSATVGGTVATNAGGLRGPPLRRHPGPGARGRGGAGHRRRWSRTWGAC